MLNFPKNFPIVIAIKDWYGLQKGYGMCKCQQMRYVHALIVMILVANVVPAASASCTMS